MLVADKSAQKSDAAVMIGLVLGERAFGFDYASEYVGCCFCCLSELFGLNGNLSRQIVGLGIC